MTVHLLFCTTNMVSAIQENLNGCYNVTSLFGLIRDAASRRDSMLIKKTNKHCVHKSLRRPHKYFGQIHLHLQHI